MSTINTTTLDNGLRIITDYVPSMHSVALGIWVGAGARHEHAENNGVAHMVEHMLFKGTTTRSAQDIVEVIENVGGNMNAYTSREVTSYHAHVLKDDAFLAFDVLSDMYRNSTLLDQEIERERAVILQEIGMCNDTPDDLVFDHYYEASYSNQAVGAPILGRPDIIQNINEQTLRAYIDDHYNAANTVISAAGNIDHDMLARHAQELFGDLKKTSKATINAANYTGGERRTQKALEQAHFVLGFRGESRQSDNLYAAQAVASILGGGMSSRLFQEVREKRGLVYSIFAFHSALQDSGLLGVYAGTDPARLSEITPVICDELHNVCEHLSAHEVERAKAQMKAALLMGRESMMTRADQQAKHVLFHTDAFDPNRRVAHIDALDINTIKNTARTLFQTTPTLSALGPLDALESFDKISSRMAA